MGNGWIYLLKSTAGRWDGWCRLGRTEFPIERFQWWRSISNMNGWGLYPLYLVAVNDQKAAEGMMHEAFATKRTTWRYRGMGKRHEWFKLDAPDIVSFLYWADIIGLETIALQGRWENVKAAVV